MALADIGLIGLAVMGQNLVLNMNDHGFKVAVFNRSISKVDEFLTGPARGTNVIGTYSIEEMVKKLKKPRRIILMIKAGLAVDTFIDKLTPLLDRGDIIIDGGNSLYTDTNRRIRTLSGKGFLYIGAGISGGEEGARNGPSIMPGGNPEAWPHVRDIFRKIAAIADGEPCCDWVGEEGSGHFVKMVHNGIEYGDMQLICEAYDFLHRGLGLDHETIQSLFREWNQGLLDSYLMEISTDILGFKDEDGTFLLKKILDTAGQKETGKWTGITALDKGIPLTLIAEAVFARFLSAMKEERVKAAKILEGPVIVLHQDTDKLMRYVEHALYASKIISYAQGYMLMKEAARNYGWNLNYGGIALMWRGGCIIRSSFLGNIKKAFDKNPGLENLLLDDFFRKAIHETQEGWRKVVAKAVELGIPTPAFSSGLAYYDGYRSVRLPANLLQAQRDYFGAHTYERVDRPRGEFFHTDWISHRGRSPSTTYDV